MTRFSSRLSCSCCGNRLIAPESSVYVSEEDEVRNTWCCAECGHEFETSFPPIPHRMSPQIIEQFFPSLLVA
jgi:hypothetical protein